MKWGVVTLFPTMVVDALAHGVIGRAMDKGLVELTTFNPRVYATDVHQTVDDRPYGGGPGMLMKVETLRASIADAKAALPNALVVYLSPQGEPLTQQLVRELAALPEVILVCGRYEGIDERVIELDIDREISLGDFVLSGGEPAAVALVDAPSCSIYFGQGLCPISFLLHVCDPAYLLVYSWYSIYHTKVGPGRVMECVQRSLHTGRTYAIRRLKRT